MSAPLLSVILPNYNHGKFLPKCFAGLLAQTMKDFEVIVVDDGSSDNSASLIANYAQHDPRVKAEYFPQNRGLQAAFQNITARATGKYLYPAGADDFVINKDFFALAVAALEQDPRPAGFYGITGIYLSEKEKLVESCGTAEVEGYNPPLQCTQGFLRCRSVVTSTSCVWRHDLFRKYNFDELIKTYGPQTDFFVNHALAFTHGMTYQRTPFACQRIFEAKTSYSANLDLWKSARYFSELERGLRQLNVAYPEIETDWARWRAFWMMDTIRKSGVLPVG